MATQFPNEAHLKTVLSVLKSEFPKGSNGGISVVKKISGSNTWSQHAWGNAVDFMVPSLEYGDQVYRYVASHKTSLGVGTVLWRVKDHYNHLHIEGANKQRGTPPAVSGRSVESVGTVATNSGLPNPVRAVGDVIGGVAGIGDFLSLLVDPQTYLRVVWIGLGLYATIGAVVIFTKELTGVNPMDLIGKANPVGAITSMVGKG